MPGISAGLGGQVNNNIQTDGLVFYIDSAYKKSYPGNGTTWNDLGGSNNGTLTNGPTFTDKSVVFDGSDDYVDFGDIGVANAYHFSIWFYLESSVDSSTSYYGLFRNENIDQSGVHFGSTTSLGVDETLTMLYSADDSAGGDPYYRTYIRDNFAVGWHYVSLNWNSNKYDIYVNADSKTTYASTDINAINTPLSGTAAAHVPLMTMDEFKLGYGSYYTGAHPEFDGRIQVVQIYDKSLTASEIKQNYDASKERFGL